MKKKKKVSFKKRVQRTKKIWGRKLNFFFNPDLSSIFNDVYLGSFDRNGRR
jgi:hypothetical protein